jgi:FimV-like protein
MGDLPTARILIREVLSSPNQVLHGKANELLKEINELDK